jgi:hypothetical protein
MAFRLEQEVIVLGFLIDGERRDAGGRYEGPGRGSNKDKHVVRIMGVRVHVEESKIVDAKEYWDKRNRRNFEND